MNLLFKKKTKFILFGLFLFISLALPAKSEAYLCGVCQSIGWDLWDCPNGTCVSGTNCNYGSAYCSIFMGSPIGCEYPNRDTTQCSAPANYCEDIGGSGGFRITWYQGTGPTCYNPSGWLCGYSSQYCGLRDFDDPAQGQCCSYNCNAATGCFIGDYDTYCDRTCSDYCSGNQLVEYTSNCVADSITVYGNCSACDCYNIPTCASQPTVTHCCAGRCGAECNSGDVQVCGECGSGVQACQSDCMWGSCVEYPFSVVSEDTTPTDIFRDTDGNWWMSGYDTKRVYKYSFDWTYTGESYYVAAGQPSGPDIPPQGFNYEEDAVSPYFNGDGWIVAFADWSGSTYYDVRIYGDWNTFLWGYPIGSFKRVYGVIEDFRVIGVWTDDTTRVANVGDPNNPTGVHILNEISQPRDVAIGPGGHYWALDDSTDRVHEYDSGWNYTGNSYYLGNEDTSPQGIFWSGSLWYMVGSETDKVYVYNSIWEEIPSVYSDCAICGSGDCVGNYECDLGSHTCTSVCSSEGNSCGNCGTCSAGSCSDQKTNGETCSGGGECCSGNCVDGVCCDSACSGTCQSCDYTGQVGTCYTHPEGTDPDNECSPDSWECSGQCQLYRSPGTCDGDSAACENEDLEYGNISSGYVCTGSGSQTPVSSSDYCNYDENCDSGDCSATEWFTSCNGSGACRIASDHTDAASQAVFADSGYSLNDVCGIQGSAQCNGTDHCTGDTRYSGYMCNGSGVCNLDNGAIGCCQDSACLSCGFSECAGSFVCDTDIYNCTGVCNSSGNACGDCGICLGGFCSGEGCSPGANQGCGNCGSQTCQSDCTWGSCQGEGVCNSGQPADNPNCPCPADVCVAANHYDYPDFGDCSGSCTCQTGTGTGQPCEPAISYNDPQCIPTASISCDPTGCGLPLGQCNAYTGCLFTLVNESTDPGGLGNIAASSWNIYGWGGNPDLDCGGLCDYTPSGLSPTDYTVELYVENWGGASDITTKDFTIWQGAVADFMCSLTNATGTWQDCNILSVTQGETVYFKDDSSLSNYSIPSEGATSIISRTWKKNGITFAPGGSFGANETNPYIIVSKGQNTVGLTILDDAARSDYEEYSFNVRPPLPEWREVAP